MIPAKGCHCPMCRTERQLIASLEHSESKNAFQKLCDLCPPIRKFSSIAEFITHLHTTDGNSERHRSNDQLLSALVRALAGNHSESVLQAVLILAFIPALHRTSRDVSYLFPSLYEQDVCQQVLVTFLRVSLSRSIQRRTGFVPIAITRSVRKIVFRWAFREVHEAEIQKEPGSSNPKLARPDPFESYLLLRDFFQHCGRSDSADVERPALSESGRTGVLAASEQQVLTKLKLEGLSAKQLAQLEGPDLAAGIRRVKGVRRLADVRLFITADFDCSRSGSFRTILGVRLCLLFAMECGLQLPWRKHYSVLDFLTSSAFVGTNPTDESIYAHVHPSCAASIQEPGLCKLRRPKCQSIHLRNCDWLVRTQQGHSSASLP